MAEFKNSDTVENVSREPRQGRMRRQKKLLPKRLFQLIAGLVVVVILVVVIVVAVSAAGDTSEAADYQRYMASVSDILKQSDSIGVKLTELLTNPGDTNRKDIQTKLDQYVATSAGLEKQAKELQVPKELLNANVHQFFVLVMTFRSQGLAGLKPSLMNALDTQDSDVVADQISQALYYLTNSDFLYATVFVKGATDVLKEKNLQGVTVPNSKFVKDPDLASRAQAQEIIAQLKSTGNLQAVHGVALARVMAQPDEQQIKNGQTYNLTASDQLAFDVSVENQGNMSEKDVPVVVTLSTEEGEPQTKTVTIPELKPGATVTIPVEGLNPTDYGVVAKLTVEAGPVPGEKVKTNNSIEANVIFKL